MLRGLESLPDWKVAVALTVVLRIFYSGFAAVLAFVLKPNPVLVYSNVLTGNLPQPGSIYYAFLGIWQRFDTLWYLHIANHGYDLPASVVFHPLYPGLIRVLSPLTGALLAALMISTVATGFLFAGILRLGRMGLSERSRRRATLLLAVWPTGFIFFSGYTDSLAAALVVWCIVLAREKNWLAASLLACLAGLTRSMGALLVVPLLVMAWRERRWSVWPVILSPLGTLAYWGWLHSTGRPSIVAAYRAYWTTQVVAPWTTLWNAICELFHHPDLLLLFSLATLALFARTGMSVRRQAEERFFTAAVITHILLRLCKPPLLGTQRYMMPVFPAFLTMGETLAKLDERRFAWLCVGLFAFNLAWMYAFLNWSLVL